MKTTSKCQVTLTQPLRSVVGIGPGQQVDAFIIQHEGKPVIAIAPVSGESKGQAMADRLTGFLKNKGTTDTILKEVRGR